MTNKPWNKPGEGWDNWSNSNSSVKDLDTKSAELVEVIDDNKPAAVLDLSGNPVDPAVIQKVKETADLIFAGADTPEWMKTKLQIKWIWYNPKQSKLMRKRISDVADTSNKNWKEAQTALLNLQKESEKIFPVLDKATSAKGLLHKIAKFVPFVWGRVEDYLIKLQSIQETMQNMVDSLEWAEKELQNTNTELDTLQQANIQDIETIKQQITFGHLLVEEIKSRMLALPAAAWEIDKNALIEKDVLLPVMTRISDLGQKAIVAQQWVMNMANIKEWNDALIAWLRRAQEVTMFALEQTLIQFIAANRQWEIFDWLDKLNTGTGKLVAKLSSNIKEQSIAIAEKTTSQTLDITVLKQARDDAKTTLLEVQKVYKTALPKMEAQVRALEQINAEAAEFIKQIENKEGTNQTSLQIIEDLGQ